MKKTIGFFVSYWCLGFVVLLIENIIIQFDGLFLDLDSVSGQYINLFICVIVIGLSYFWGTWLEAKLLSTRASVGAAMIFVIVRNCFDIPNLNNWVIITVFIVTILTSEFPLYLRLIKINKDEQIVYSTWNLNPDGTAQCNNCKHTVSFKDGPIFICPNCKADMRKPRQ